MTESISDEDRVRLETALAAALDLVEQRRFDEAEQAFAPLLATRPTFDWAHYTHGCFRLLRGDYTRGWREFERRFGIPGYRGFPAEAFAQPRWNGAIKPDQTLFLHMDQGFGDGIMCARWLPRVRRRVGKLILALPPELKDLMLAIEPDSGIVLVGEGIPAFDMHLHFMSLPAVFDAAPKAIPPAPYVKPDPDRVAYWKDRLGPGSAPRVGLIWQGSPGHASDGKRSIPLATLAPILAVPSIRFVSLQIGPESEQLREVPAAGNIADLGPELAASPLGFMESAALMAALDLVITIDSAPAHLAGAIGQKAWVLLQDPPDWRWLLDREDSVWYPSLRLFRQPAPRAWQPVIERVAGELKALFAK